MKIIAGKLDTREYFKNLRGRDRRNLTDVLGILKSNGLNRVIFGGSSVITPKEYGDIDMLVGSNLIENVNKIRQYERVIDLLIQKGAIVTLKTRDKEEGYVGTIITDRTGLFYEGTLFDICFRRYKDGRGGLITLSKSIEGDEMRRIY